MARALRTHWLVIAACVGLGALIAASALGTDAPHDETNPNFGSQYCATCHIPHNGYGTLLNPARGATVNQLCESCHYSGGPAPKVLTHGSVRGQAGCDFCLYTFEVACTNCHNPHMHQQPYENDTPPDGLPDAFIKAAIRPWSITCSDVDCEPGQHRRDLDNVCVADEQCTGNCTNDEICITNPSGDETICQCPIGFDGAASCSGCDPDGNFSGVDCAPVLCGTPPDRCGYGTCSDGCEIEGCPVGQHREDGGGTCTDDVGCVAGQCTPANGGACLESPIDGDAYCDCPVGTVGPDCSSCASGPNIGFDGASCTVDCSVLGAGADCGYGGTCAITSDCPNVNCGASEHRSDTTGTCTADNRCGAGDCTPANGGACLETAHDLEAYCDCPIGTTGGDCSTCAPGFTGAGCTVDCIGRVGLACGHGGTCIAGGGGSPSNEYPTAAVASGQGSNATDALTDDGVDASVQTRGGGGVSGDVTVSGFSTTETGTMNVVAWVEYRTDTGWGDDTYTFVAAIDGTTFDQVIVPSNATEQASYTTASLDLGNLTQAQVGTLAIRMEASVVGGQDRNNVYMDVGWIVITPSGGDACDGNCDPGYAGADCDQCDTGGGYVELNDGTCAPADPCASVTCVNGGTCFVDSSGAASCDCPGQYYDATCSTCTAPTVLGCDGACDAGYTGTNCDQCDTGGGYVEANDGTCVASDPCAGVTCNNGGTCYDDNGTGVCDCPNQWYDGSCSTCGAGITCVCDVGYAGTNCDLCDTAGGYVELNDGTCGPDPCAGVNCSNGGTCYVDDAGLAACDCVGQYYDATCSSCDAGAAPADKPIILATEAGTVDSFADGAGDDLGICEVCHTQTQHHRSPGANGPIAHNVDQPCTTCHIHSAADNPPPEQGDWGFLPSQGSQGCPSCHLATSGAGTQDVDSWAWDGTKALIDVDEYERFGHGNFAQANYECGGGRAGFGDQGTAEGDAGCMYCHDRGVSHNTKGNYFRLRNWGTVNRSDGGPPQNDTCLTCHHSNSDGFAPGEALDQVWQRDDDGGPSGWTDVTAEFNDTTTNDWPVLPAANAPGDYAAFGKAERFSGLTVDNAGGQAGAGGAVSWEYWNGTTWASLSGVGDATGGFTAQPSNNQRVSWTVPSDWATTSLNGAGPFYYVRAAVVTSYTTQPIYDTGVDGNWNVIDGPDIDDGSGNTHPWHQGNKHSDPPEDEGGDPYLFTGKDNGGKFCWDCHDPHGDEPTGGGYYCKMIQRRPIVNTDTDGVPQLEADEVVFADTVAADTAALNCDDFRATNGLCRNCHSDDQHALGLHYTKTLNDTHPEAAPNNGCLTPETDTCMTCHEHTTGFQGVLVGGTCFTCHMSGETTDLISYEIGDAVGQAKISETEWLDTGHGRATGTYGSGNPAANFNAQPDNGCYYCHDNSLFPAQHQQNRASTTNYFLLANYDALSRGENDPANDVCLVCHDVDNATGYDAAGQYTEKCNPSTSPCVTTTIGEAHWTTQHGGPGKSGGKLCWNCHDPHGDYDASSNPLDLMVQNRPWMDLDADDVPTNDPPTWSDLAATPVFQVSGGSDPNNVDFEDLTGNFTAGDALCGNCHDPAIVDNCNQTTCPGHNLSTGKTKCTDCHKHTGEFEGEGQCVDCHNAAQPGSSPVRRPVIADFDSVQPSPNDTSQFIRSHHVGTGADIVTSDLGTEASFMGGQLTSNDCILCHAEGYLDTTDGVVKISEVYHFNNGGTRTIDLRDVDDPLPSPYTKTSSVAVFPFDKSAIEARGLVYTLSSWNASNPGWVAQTSANLDPFCLTCHDDDGASAAYALGEHDGVGGMGTTLSSAGNPFNDGTITNEYDRTPRPSRIGAPDAAGSIVDIASKVAGAYSRHAIRDSGFNSFYSVYDGALTTLWNANALVQTGISEPGTDPSAGGPQWNDMSVMSCADCHTSDGSNTLGGSGTLGNAHGSDSEYLLRNASRLAAEGFADKDGGDYVCYQCHETLVYNFSDGSHTGSGNEWGADTAAAVGASRLGSNGTIFGMLCFNCHGGSDWGNIHGTSEVFSVGTGPVNRNAYRFVNGAAMRFYDPSSNDGAYDPGNEDAEFDQPTFGCYTISTGNEFSQCTQHGKFSKAWNRTVQRPLSY